MMRNPEQTIGNLIDKQKNAFIASRLPDNHDLSAKVEAK